MRECGKVIVVTTINRPTLPMRRLAEKRDDWDIVVVADKKTPPDWHLDGCRLLTVDQQDAMFKNLSTAIPYNHYSRKMLGYAHAIRSGATLIAETDDDNEPLAGWPSSDEVVFGRLIRSADRWLNPYEYFSDEETLWPRGFPLQLIRGQSRSECLGQEERRAAIQQWLANGDPDVDAIYRLIVGKVDHKFSGEPLLLTPGTVSPFNSQCTTWLPEAFPLLYLPSTVSFRMTDIVRSFVAQACLAAVGGTLAYHGPGVFQDRNEHNLLRDFADEVSGYLNNARIVSELFRLPLASDSCSIYSNLQVCYEMLVDLGVCEPRELPMLEQWATATRQSLPSGAPE